MYSEDFAVRLAQLRELKGVSARDMSLSIGQNAGYINNIETGKAFPSMNSFFYICEYLNITPQDFFEAEVHNPETLNTLISYFKKLNCEQQNHITAIVRDLAGK